MLPPARLPACRLRVVLYLGFSTREAGQTSGNLPVRLPPAAALVLQERGGLHPVRGNPEAVGEADAVPDLGDGLPNAVGVDLAHPDTPVQLEAVLPLLQVHRTGDGGPVVGDEGLQGAVEEEIILLRSENSRPAVVVEARQLEDIHTALELQLVPERHEAAEGGGLAPAVPVHHQDGALPAAAGHPHLLLVHHLRKYFD